MSSVHLWVTNTLQKRIYWEQWGDGFTHQPANVAFHDTGIDTDTNSLARILADTSDTRDFMKLFLWQAERGSRSTSRHPRDDPHEDVGEDVGVRVGVVECGLYR